MQRAILAALLLTSAVPVLAQTPPPPPSVLVQGEATIKRTADRAWINVAVETRDARADEARRLNAEAMTAAQTALKATGLPADAIRTSGYSVVPNMEWNNGRSTMRGYIVRNSIDVRIDDIAKVSDVVDAVTAMNRSTVSINGPRFDLKDERAAQNEALRQAVESALSRAEAVAAGARRTLGSIVRIETQGVGGPPRPSYAPMARMAVQSGEAQQTPITAGEIEITAQVAVTIELR